jgi:hypothetical protein
MIFSECLLAAMIHIASSLRSSEECDNPRLNQLLET